MKYIRIISLILITILISISIIYFIINQLNVSNKIVNNSTIIIDTQNNSIINHIIATDTPSNNSNLSLDNTNLQPVNSEYVFNNINWSRYPGIDPICVRTNEISAPTSVINHSHIWFVIDVTIKDPENINELLREMAGIVIEIRDMVGPNSTPYVYGVENGYLIYTAHMVPYDDQIYASDHYHPNAYKNDIYLIPGDDIYDYHNYTLINNSVVEP